MIFIMQLDFFLVIHLIVVSSTRKKSFFIINSLKNCYKSPISQEAVCVCVCVCASAHACQIAYTEKLVVQSKTKTEMENKLFTTDETKINRIYNI
jgi:hypothetical protein